MEGKILIVEDDPITKQFYSYLFQQHCDLELIQTEDVEEIFRYLREENIKVVALDINLRNSYYNGKLISGIELSKMIKENEDFGNPKIVLVTAYSLSKNHPDFIESKADKFIMKPIGDFNKFLREFRTLAEK